jgi:two-component system response regulator FlrC
MSQTQILVVEDDSGLREALVDTLTIAGYSVIEADSAESALVLLKQKVIDLIVSDVQMGGLSGLDLLKSVKKTVSKRSVFTNDSIRDHRSCG